MAAHSAIYRYAFFCLLCLLSPLASSQNVKCDTASPLTETEASHTINYTALNQLLTSPNSQQRVQELPQWIKQVKQSNVAEQQALYAQLLQALALAQHANGKTTEAIATLKQFPLSDHHAPYALLLMGTLEASQGNLKKAQLWYLQAADLFPTNSYGIEAMLAAAQLEENAALKQQLLQTAATHSRQQLQAISQWRDTISDSEKYDHIDWLQTSSDLQDIAYKAITSRTFNQALEADKTSQHLLQCLLDNETKRQQHEQDNPQLLQTMADTLIQVKAALQDLREQLAHTEQVFEQLAAALKTCTSECAPLLQQRNRLGQKITAWRNRINSTQTKSDFLEKNYQAIPQRWQKEREQAAKLALVLASENTLARHIMQLAMQEALNHSQAEWETLTAKAYRELAMAQQSRSNR